MTESMLTQIEAHQTAVEAVKADVSLLERIADRLLASFDSGGRLYILGNGGSAADAQHIAAELVGRFKHDRRALPAIALTTDTSILTAVVNDTGGENCFARQVDALVTHPDVVWALSVSGSSPNVIRAMTRARAIGACTIGFTGRTGDALAELSDYCFRAAHEVSDRVQEIHQLAYHLVCDRIEQSIVRGEIKVAAASG
ncbi:MAG: SIS domain-containing protein [Planctomycetes bacterium]|nr:SIS domain-containing protein [Planctomycetota bacterium]